VSINEMCKDFYLMFVQYNRFWRESLRHCLPSHRFIRKQSSEERQKERERQRRWFLTASISNMRTNSSSRPIFSAVGPADRGTMTYKASSSETHLLVRQATILRYNDTPLLRATPPFCPPLFAGAECTKRIERCVMICAHTNRDNKAKCRFTRNGILNLKRTDQLPSHLRSYLREKYHRHIAIINNNNYSVISLW